MGLIGAIFSPPSSPSILRVKDMVLLVGSCLVREDVLNGSAAEEDGEPSIYISIKCPPQQRSPLAPSPFPLSWMNKLDLSGLLYASKDHFILCVK